MWHKDVTNVDDENNNLNSNDEYDNNHHVSSSIIESSLFQTFIWSLVFRIEKHSTTVYSTCGVELYNKCFALIVYDIIIVISLVVFVNLIRINFIFVHFYFLFW